MFNEVIGNCCENHTKKIHTLCGKVLGSTLCGKVLGFLQLRQLAHIVTDGHQKIWTTQNVCMSTDGPSSTAIIF
jgi:hypothetical protein